MSSVRVNFRNVLVLIEYKAVKLGEAPLHGDSESNCFVRLQCPLSKSSAFLSPQRQAGICNTYYVYSLCRMDINHHHQSSPSIIILKHSKD